MYRPAKNTTDGLTIKLIKFVLNSIGSINCETKEGNYPQPPPPRAAPFLPLPQLIKYARKRSEPAFLHMREKVTQKPVDWLLEVRQLHI